MSWVSWFINFIQLDDTCRYICPTFALYVTPTCYICYVGLSNVYWESNLIFIEDRKTKYTSFML